MLLGTVQLNAFRGDVYVHAVGVKICDVGACHLFDHETVAEHIESEATVLFRRVAPKQSHFSQFRQGILDLARTLPTLCQGLQIELVEDRDPPAIIWAIAPSSSDPTQFLYFANAYLVRMLQAHRGSQWHPRRIFYSAAPPRRPRLYESQLSCPAVFQAPINAIEYERRDLRAIKHGVDKHVYALLTTYAEYLPSKEPRPRDMREAINLAILDGLALRSCNTEFVARRLKISTRSLGRIMNTSGASFSELRDQARMNLAELLLADVTLTISEVAYRLGYSEVAAFTHAFTHYFGESPRQFRLGRPKHFRKSHASKG